jgi:DnaJ-class molecular chaperone
MSDTTFTAAIATRDLSSESAPVAAAKQEPCDECVGSGGWFRYEPALEPSPGLLYLSCVQCRGSGRTILARA